MGSSLHENEVLCVADDGEKSQWGRSLLFFRDGYKWTLKSKAVAIIFAVVFCGLSILQLFIEPPASSLVAAKPMISMELAEKEDTLILERHEFASSATNTKKIVSASRKLSPPQLVLNSRNVSIPPGLLGEAVLTSGASNGLVRAELSESVIHQGDKLFERGTVLVGQGSSTEERLQIVFRQAVTPDGSILNIEAHACDLSDRIMGLKGEKLGPGVAKIAGSIGLGFLGGLSEGFQEVQPTSVGVIRPPSVKNALLNATAVTALEQSKNLMSDLKEAEPTIEVRGGEKICVLFGGGK